MNTFFNTKLFTCFLTLIMLLGNVLPADAKPSDKVTMNVNSMPIKEVLLQIESQTGYRFIYETAKVDLDKKISLNVKGEQVESVLKKIFRDENIKYSITENRLILINPVENPAPEQVGRKVTGTVIDETGDPIIGVSVIVKGATIGTATDADGNFKLDNVPDNAILQVSYVGYVTQSVTVGNQSHLTVTLVENVEALEEVVVVGYGTQRKVNLTGSVSTINLESVEAISRPVTDVAQVLNGASPGLQIMQSSGEPNAESFSVNIRGIGTLNSSSPLILVDGMEQSMSMVKPSDIATVSILKDAASCAIYGNRGANGVILITTKNGSDGRTNVTYDVKFSYDEPFKIIHTVSDYATYMQLFNESQTNLGQNPTFAQSIIDTWNTAKQNPNGIAPSGYPNYVAYPNIDWWDEIYTKAWMQEHTVALNGKDRKTGYSMSFSYTDNPGVVKKTGYDRFNGRLNLYNDVTDWLRVGTRIWGNVTNKDVSESGSGFFTGLGTTKMLPCTYPYYDGKYGAPENSADDPQSHNPLWDMASNDGFDKYSQLYTDWYAQVKFFKYFTYNLDFYYKDLRREKKTVNTSIGKYSFSQDTYTTGANDPATLYTYMYYTRENLYKTNHLLNYNQTFGQHDVSALLGYEEQSYDYRVTDVNKLGLTDPSVNDLNAATTPYSTAGYGTQYAARSVFGRVNYAFKSKYLFEANIRYDGSSRFAPDYRWGIFPSISAGWRVTEEAWMKNVKAVSNLKLRASWGKLGNNSIGNYDWQSTYSTANYASGNALVSGIAITAIANGALKWEETAVTNLGIDYGFMNNKLTGSIDVYDKLTSGILYTPDMYMAMGNATAPRQNIAEVTNRGIEFEIGWRDRIGSDFNYSIKANVAYNKNWVSAFKGKLLDDKSNIGDVSTGSTTRVLEDHIISEWYLPNVYKGTGKGYDVDGINGGPVNGMIRTETDMAWLKAMQSNGYSFQPSNVVAKSNLWYGEYIYADSNNDGIYGNSYDSEFQGTSTTPKYNFGLQASANWKAIDFSMSWGGSAGFSLYYYSTGRNASQTIYGYAIPQIIADDHYFYDPENPSDSRTNINSKNARLAYNASAPTAASSSLHLEKGDFLKLRNLTIGYTIPEFISKKVMIERLRIFATGENLFAITGFSGQDPEMRTTVAYSTMRQYAIGVNVTF
ncbi:MAG: TonB-dependent receptor [Tannerella sp.]|nr:TonB-dependent receptor [Tannerella sp.]